MSGPRVTTGEGAWRLTWGADGNLDGIEVWRGTGESGAYYMLARTGIWRVEARADDGALVPLMVSRYVDLDRFSEAVLRKARTLVRSGVGVSRDPDQPSVWWVTGSSGDPYRVQVSYAGAENQYRYVSCTCPHGLKAGGGDCRCYHVAAVEIRQSEGTCPVCGEFLSSGWCPDHPRVGASS